MLNLVNDKTFSIQYNGFCQGYFLGDDPFYPSIHPSGNIQTIDLIKDASNVRQIVPLVKQKGQHLLWHFASMDLRLLEEKITICMQQYILPLQSITFGLLFDLSVSPLEGQKLLQHREQLIHSFRSIAADLPENLLLFLRLDLSFIKDIQELLVFLSRDAFFPFQLICTHPELHHYPYASDYIGWHFPSCMGAMDTLEKVGSTKLTNGFLLPEDLKGKKIPTELIREKKMRMIPSSQLTELWEGMDELYLLTDSLTSISKRKVAGFEAAGGQIHFIN